MSLVETYGIPLGILLLLLIIWWFLKDSKPDARKPISSTDKENNEPESEKQDEEEPEVVSDGGFQPRNRWQLVSFIVEEDDEISDDVKDQLFDLLLLHRGSGYDLPENVPSQKIYALRKAFAIPSKGQLRSLTEETLDFIRSRSYTDLGPSEIREISNFVNEKVDTASAEAVDSDIKAKSGDISMPSTPEDVQATMSDLKNVEKLEVDLEEKLDDFKHHLAEFEKIYEQNEEVFQAIDRIQFTNYSSDAPPQELYATVKELDKHVEMDLADPQSAQVLQEAVEAMENHLRQMLQELEEMEVDIKRELGEFTNAEEPLSDMENHVDDLETLVQILEVFNGNN